MAPRRRPLPSFFKILLDRSAPQLPLPSRFVRKHLDNKIPEDPILQSVNGGYSWRLKIKKDGENYCFADGWSNVVEDSELGFGDFLVFWLVDPSTFKLSIFSPNGCERNFPPQIHDHDEDAAVKEEEEEAAVKEEEEAAVKEEEEEEEEQEDDDDEDEEEEEEEEVEDDEEEEEESDEEEEEEDDIYDGGDDEEEEDDDGDGDIDGDDGDPFFMTIISKGHTASMRLPLGFAQLAGIDEERSIKLKDLDGKEWPMGLRSENRIYRRYYLSAGWVEFKRVNELCEGDKCIFKFLRSEDMLCLAKVTKKRVPAKQPPVNAPATEVKKRSTEVEDDEEEEEEEEEYTGEVPPHVEVQSKDTGEVPPRVEVESKDSGEVLPCVEVQSKDSGEVPPRVEVQSKDTGEVPPRMEVESKDGGEVPPCVEVQSKDSGAEVVKKRGRAKQVAGEAPVAKVLKRTREQPPRGKAPATEVKRRTRGPPPPRVEVESKEEKKRGRPKRLPEKAPATEVSKRPRGRPPRAEVVEEKAESIKPADNATVAEVVKRRRRGALSVEVESKDDGGKEEVRRPRGRPFKKKRGRAAAHAK